MQLETEPWCCCNLFFFGGAFILGGGQVFLGALHFLGWKRSFCCLWSEKMSKFSWTGEGVGLGVVVLRCLLPLQMSACNCVQFITQGQQWEMHRVHYEARRLLQPRGSPVTARVTEGTNHWPLMAWQGQWKEKNGWFAEGKVREWKKERNRTGSAG